jgi:hypothetical protein
MKGLPLYFRYDLQTFCYGSLDDLPGADIHLVHCRKAARRCPGHYKNEEFKRDSLRTQVMSLPSPPVAAISHDDVLVVKDADLQDNETTNFTLHHG